MSLCRALRLALVFHSLSSLVAADTLFPTSSSTRKLQIQDVLERQPVKFPDCENTIPTGPIDTTKCDYELLESVNDDLYRNLHELVDTPFFKYFQVDLYRECPFWDDDGSCSDPGCAITSVDEREVPEKWRATALSKLNPSKIDDRHQLEGCYYRDSDFCFLDDNQDGEYYDLSLIPERYTGYSGPDSARVWRSIYQENCFGLSEQSISSNKVSGGLADGLREDASNSDTCLEKKVYYRIISGLHASISTHICLDYLNKATGEWSPNLQCFVTRIAAYPERLHNMYFNAVLVLRAVARLGPYLSSYDYCSTPHAPEAVHSSPQLDQVVSIARTVGKFDEKSLFQGDEANILKEEFKSHFRNVTRIMDCTGCDKCRLWGKVQTTGIATALKILFELDEKALDPNVNPDALSRSEVVALINTLHRFSESLDAVNKFRHMWAEISPAESEKIVQHAERVAATKPRPSPMVGLERPEDVVGDVRWRLFELLRVCKESTWECVNIVVDVWRRGVKILNAVFKPSDKRAGPVFVEL